MSRFNGPHYKGYTQHLREQKREEAEERNAATPWERARAGRRYAEALTTARGRAGRRAGR